MSRSTIDFGIDLGTTNSAIAVLQGKDVQVFKNNESQEYTPSAVWIDRNYQLFVGRAARERLESDPGNAFSEFKLQMGKHTEYRFTLSGRKMKPEELSAELGPPASTASPQSRSARPLVRRSPAYATRL